MAEGGSGHTLSAASRPPARGSGGRPTNGGTGHAISCNRVLTGK
ncbi:hypothetical protein GLE_1060 [Lysobacter enzymogenes]|uniref:Uncharacterized protein n=1 Tax=Lysobacter enzymogenes TaxID=69 RepID=A0A0S2DD00_LYSEN|nr:hypothetical protein GLE_1060 [Lysobacter enzymogenes]